MSTLPFALIYLLPLTVIVGYRLGGGWTFFTVLWMFGVIPVADLLIGNNKRNPTLAEEDALTNRLPFRLITWSIIPIQLAFVTWGAWIAGSGRLGFVEWIGLTVSIGLQSGAMGINVSHELIHRQNKFEKTLGRILLWTVGYLHWSIEHVQGHHRNVATPDDPATARRGESFYAFWPRTVGGTFLSAWGIEKLRVERLGAKAVSARNRILIYLALESALLAGLWIAFGFGAALFWAVQCVIGFSLLEAVNYIEHYGLLRRKLGEKYEPVSPQHSWNSSAWLTNRFLFHLQRHSDHHAQPQRRYQILRHFDESPQLPTGYSGMVLVALVPPLWFAMMDARIDLQESRLHEAAARD